MSRLHEHFREILSLKENLNLSGRTENVYFPSIKSLPVIQQKYRGMKKSKTKQDKEISQHYNKQRFEALNFP